MEREQNEKENAIAQLKAEYCKLSTSPKRMKEIMQEIIRLRLEIMNEPR